MITVFRMRVRYRSLNGLERFVFWIFMLSDLSLYPLLSILLSLPPSRLTAIPQWFTLWRDRSFYGYSGVLCIIRFSPAMYSLYNHTAFRVGQGKLQKLGSVHFS